MAKAHISDEEAARIDAEARASGRPALRAPSRSEWYRRFFRDRAVLRNRDEVQRDARIMASPAESGLATAANVVNPVAAIEGARETGRAARRIVNTAMGGLTGDARASLDDAVTVGAALLTGRIVHGAQKKPGIIRKAFGSDPGSKVLDGMKTEVTKARAKFEAARAAEAKPPVELKAASAAADNFDRMTHEWLRQAEAVFNEDPTLAPLVDKVIDYANARAGSEAGQALVARLEAAHRAASPENMAALHETTRAAAADLSERMGALAERTAYEKQVMHAPEWVKNANPAGKLAKGVRWLAKQGTSRGTVPKMLSSVERGIGSVIADVQGKPGEILHAISSPGANALALDLAGAAVTGGYIARKTGLWDPDRKVVEESEKAAKPTMGQEISRATFDALRQDYALISRTNRTAAAQMRDATIANMDPAVVDAELKKVRGSVFSLHNPGMNIDSLSTTPQGKAFVERFDSDIFGARPANDWLVSDLSQYARDLEAASTEGGM